MSDTKDILIYGSEQLGICERDRCIHVRRKWLTCPNAQGQKTEKGCHFVGCKRRSPKEFAEVLDPLRLILCPDIVESLGGITEERSIVLHAKDTVSYHTCSEVGGVANFSTCFKISV